MAYIKHGQLIIPESAKQHAQTPVDIRRSFAAAQQTNLTASWTQGPVSINQVLYQQLSLLRARSRSEWMRNDYVKQFGRMVKVNVVGPDGIKFQSRPAQNGDISLSPEAARMLEKDYEKWGSGPVPTACDYSGRANLKSLTAQCVLSCAIDGCGLFRIHRGERVNEWGFAIEALDPELLDTNHNQQLQNGNRIIMGVEYNSRMRPVYYHLTPSAQRNAFWGHVGDSPQITKRVKVSADNIIHVFDQEMPGMLTGIPWGATPLMAAHQIEGFREAALAAAQYGAAKMAFIKSPDGTRPDGEGYWPSGYKLTRVVPGSIELLPEGTEVEPFDPGYPNGETRPFMEGTLRGMASGYGVSYEALANDRSGVNFSSLRGGKLEERDYWRDRQEIVISQFSDRVTQEWLGARMMTDTRRFSFADLEVMGVFKNQARGWTWVDPQREVNASFTEVAANAKSLSQHIRDAGRDPEEVWAEIARDRQAMATLGIGMGTVYGESIREGTFAEEQINE